MSLNLGIIASSRATVPPVTPLLDTYPGAAAAYSLRKLRTAYTGSAIRVRRSSDNTETDIGFVNNVLDTATLLTFCGAGNGFVTIWYDQSGNSNNLFQTISSEQPRIVESGIVFTSGIRPAIYGLNVGTSGWNLTSPILANTDYSQYTVMAALTSKAISFSAKPTSYYPWSGLANDADNLFYFFNNTKYGTFSLLGVGRGLYSLYNNSLTLSAYLNGVSKVVTNTSLVTSANYTFFGATNLDSGRNPWQESIWYSSNQISNNSGINANINSFYTIY